MEQKFSNLDRNICQKLSIKSFFFNSVFLVDTATAGSCPVHVALQPDSAPKAVEMLPSSLKTLLGRILEAKRGQILEAERGRILSIEPGWILDIRSTLLSVEMSAHSWTEFGTR